MGKEKKGGNKYDFASTDLLIYTWEKKVPLVIISVAAAILSVIVSFTITPMFKSTAILFPTTNASVSKNLLSDNYSGRFSIYEIGEEEQSEQLMQVLNSEEIKNRIVEKYKLMEHYKIDPESKYPLTQLNDAYRSKVRIRRTEFMSVEVEVMDKDPQMAADIANDIVALTDTVYNRMLQTRANEAFLIVQKEYKDLTEKYMILKDSLDGIRQLGVNNYSVQSDRYHEAYGKALVVGNEQAIRALDQKFKTISKYGGTYDALNLRASYTLSILSRMEQRYIEAEVEATQPLPHKFIVDRAVKAEKKFYPKKSIIVIVSTLSAFLLGLLMFMISENLKKKLK